MTFLVIFIAVLLVRNVQLLRLNPQSPIFKYWQRLFQHFGLFNKLPSLVRYLLVVGLPTVAIAVGFYALEPVFFGLVNLALELCLLVYVLLHADVIRQLRHYQHAVKESDFAEAYILAKQSLAIKDIAEEDYCSLNESVIKGLLYRWFCYVFLMIFWYLLLDVPGMMLAWLSVQYTEDKANENACAYLHLLEIIPARLLGLTFVIAGNLRRSLSVWRHYLGQWRKPSSELLFCVAAHALTESPEQRQCFDITVDAKAAAAELDEWLQLYFYSVSIWLVMIAVATVGGWLL